MTRAISTGWLVFLAVLVCVGAFIAAIVVFEPPWAIDPLRSAGERAFETLGAALYPIAAWAIAFLLIVRFKPRWLYRRWRLLLGTAAVVFGALTALSLFEAGLPLIGEANLGGSVGQDVAGGSLLVGWTIAIASALVGTLLIMAKPLAWVRRRRQQQSQPVPELEEEPEPFGLPERAGRLAGTGAREVLDRASDVRQSIVARDEPMRGAEPQRVQAPSRRWDDDADSSRDTRRTLEPVSEAPLGPETRKGLHTLLGTNLGYLRRVMRNLSDPDASPKRIAAEPRKAPAPPLPPPAREEAPPLRELGHSPAREALATAHAIADEVLHTPPGEQRRAQDGATRSTQPVFMEDDDALLDVSPSLETDMPAPAPPRPTQESPKPMPRVRPQPTDEVWSLPSARVLAPAGEEADITEEHKEIARIIEDTLSDHRVEVRVAEVRVGPSVTMYGLVPGWSRRLGSARLPEDDPASLEGAKRVRVDAILQREKDLALALAAPSLRIEAPVPGESVVGVEVPNRRSTPVPIRAVLESESYQDIVGEGGLAVALGQASAGEPVAVNLQKMPHLLVAGATGSGKSVCMNTIISSLIMNQQPSDVRMLLIDPKRVELTPYNGVPHLVAPVVVDPDRVVRLLRGAIQEMLRRYQLLEEAGVRNLQSYNRSPRKTEDIPYLVICIDELADLMMTSSFDVEQGICRLAQLGRATGIHLIVATQRPSVDVVTGLIKANFPSRISFAVASQVDSRTILDMAGAERLLGRGDMLFLSPDAAKPRRVQGTYISEDETEAIASHWRMQRGPEVAEIDLEALAEEAERAGVTMSGAPASTDGDEDSLVERALQLAQVERALSTSLLQRKLGIGYPRAARLMDQLEAEGIVGQSSAPGKPRPVIIPQDDQ